MLVGVRGVREGARQQLRIAEAIAETRLQAGAPVRARVCLDRAYPRTLRKTSVAFVPPKPKAFDMTTSTSCLRAWFGT